MHARMYARRCAGCVDMHEYACMHVMEFAHLRMSIMRIRITMYLSIYRSNYVI